MADPCESGWVPHDDWEDDVDMQGCEEIPEGWKPVETYIGKQDGYVRFVITEPQTGRTVCAVRYPPEVARFVAQNLTFYSIKCEDEDA